MKKIVDMRYFTSEINDDVLMQIAESLNDGFEVLKMETSWNQKTISSYQAHTACIIAILVKVEKEVDKEQDTNLVYSDDTNVSYNSSEGSGLESRIDFDGNTAKIVYNSDYKKKK